MADPKFGILGYPLVAYHRTASAVQYVMSPVVKYGGRALTGLTLMVLGVRGAQNLKDGTAKVAHGFKHIFGQTKEQKLDREIADAIAHVDTKKQLVYKAIIQTQLKYNESIPLYYTPATASSSVSWLADNIKFLVKLLDNMTATNLIDVQPMMGPVGLAYHLGFRYETPARDRADGKRMNFEVYRSTVEAITRKLRTFFTMEARQDSYHQGDMKEEIESILASELAYEFNNEMIHHMQNLANVEEDMPFDGNLAVFINQAANKVAQRTRRGAANFAVMSPMSLTRLQASTTSAFVSSPSAKYNSNGLIYAGTLNGTIAVYISFIIGENDILLGYKGTGDIDGGLAYCPYIMLMSSGVVVDPQTYQPQVQMMTRYGLSENEMASDYYAKFSVAPYFELKDTHVTND